MPRPKRAKVASKAAAPRVAEPTDIPNARSSVMLAARVKAADSEYHGEASPAKAYGRTRGRKVAPVEGQTRALNALRKTRDEALKAHGGGQPGASLKRQTATVQSAKNAPDMHASSTPKPSRQNAIAQIPRDKTPPIYEPDDDLYGLSPAGERSLAKIEAAKKSQQKTTTTQPQITTAPPSALRVRGTPAAEASILALANFKRRPRQPSIIRLVQQASEIGDDLDFDYPEPDDESTPLNLNKGKSWESPSSQHDNSVSPRTSSSRKRKFDEIQDSGTEPHIASSPPPSPSRTPSHPHLQQDEEPDLPEHPSLSPSRRAPPPKPSVNSDTMAEPRSSSSLTLPPQPLTHARTSTQQRHSRKPRRSTRQPQRTPRANTRNPNTDRYNISTAALQTLLPRPRHRAAPTRVRDAFDISSSDTRRESERDAETWDISADSEREEEVHARRRVRQRRSGNAVAAARKQGVGGGGKKRGGSATVAGSPGFGVGRRKGTGTTLAVALGRPGKRTYGRRGEEDKENDGSVAGLADGESEDSDGVGCVNEMGRSKGIKDVAMSKELEAARKKFAEIDDWEMEFESVDVGGTSSPWR